MKQHFFEDEQEITRSDNDIVILTSHRIRFDDSKHVISIMLEKVSSIEVHYRSWLICLLVGILAAAAGLGIGADNNGQAMIVGLVLGAVLILAYFLTRKHVISIASDGGTKINFETRGMKREAILKFINQIEKAKKDQLLNYHAQVSL